MSAAASRALSPLNEIGEPAVLPFVLAYSAAFAAGRCGAPSIPMLPRHPASVFFPSLGPSDLGNAGAQSAELLAKLRRADLAIPRPARVGAIARRIPGDVRWVPGQREEEVSAIRTDAVGIPGGAAGGGLVPAGMAMDDEEGLVQHGGDAALMAHLEAAHGRRGKPQAMSVIERWSIGEQEDEDDEEDELLRGMARAGAGFRGRGASRQRPVAAAAARVLRRGDAAMLEGDAVAVGGAREAPVGPGGSLVRLSLWRAGDPLRVWPQVQVEPGEDVNGAGDGTLLLLDGGAIAAASAVAGSAEGIGLHSGGGAVAASACAPAGAGAGGAGDAWLVAHLTIADVAPSRVRSGFAAAALRPWLLSGRQARRREAQKNAEKEAAAAARSVGGSASGDGDSASGSGPRARRASDASAARAGVTSKARALLGAGVATGPAALP